VKSFPLIGYWLSVVPFMPYLKHWFTDFACTVLPEFFSGLSVNNDTASKDRVTVGMIQQLLAFTQSSNISSRFREVRQKTSLTRNVAGLAVRNVQPSPAPAGGATLLTSDLVGKSEATATEAATAKGLTVETQPFQPTIGASAVRDIGGLFRTAQPGDKVTLFTDDSGEVRFFDIARPATGIATGIATAPIGVGPAGLTPDTAGFEGPTVQQVNALQERLTKANTDLETVRNQLNTLAAAHEELRALVQPSGEKPPTKQATTTKTTAKKTAAKKAGAQKATEPKPEQKAPTRRTRKSPE
jgi:hypothetical protein